MGTIKEIFREHISWRGQILKLAKADIIKTYSGAALGWAWALIKPAMTIAVFWFAFTFGLRGGHSVEGYSFVLWMMAGFSAWFYIADMITDGANAIRRYRYLVTKMKFPVSTIPTFVGMADLAIHVALLCIILLLFVATGHMPDIYWLQLPVYMLFMVLICIAWALFSSMLGAMSRDFINLVKALKTPIFWMSGILWDVNNIGIPWMKTALYFNPVTYLATGYRNCLIYTVWFWEQPLQLCIFLGFLIVMVLAAMWSYHKLIREIPDVL